MSRCMSFLACRYAIAEAICLTILAIHLAGGCSGDAVWEQDSDMRLSKLPS